MKKVFKLEDLDCANCAAKMERAIAKIEGVNSVSVSFMMQKNDCVELIGDQVVTMYIGGSYQEPEINEAIKCVSFGMNATSSVYINEEETTFDPNTSVNNEGTYYIVYQTSNFKYSSITRIRTIIVNAIDENEDGIGED